MDIILISFNTKMLLWMQTSEREIFDSETMAQDEELQKNGTENVKTNRNSHHQEMGEFNA
jgi:uncharacterized membrane protein